MQLSLTTLISLRRALLALLCAVDTALREGYGWTPRGAPLQVGAERDTIEI
jgi:hypothetical protein